MARAVEAGKKQFVGFELPGRTLGVIGLGAVGVQVANAALGLGLNVVGFDPGISVEHAWHLSAEVERAETMEEVFRRADILTVHVPLIESTRGLVSTQRIALMKETAVLLNFARAEIVDEAAVVAALDEGTLGGYVCDFPSTAVHKHPKCISLPHLGASTKEAERNCAVMAVDELRGFLEDGQVHNSVNFPEAVLPREPGTRRLVIVNQNVPNMVGQVSTLVAERGQNIANLLNRSRGDLAVTLVDVEGELDEDVLEQLRAIDGVLSARAIEPAV
nr:phosphoglycerate dehydrogenase [Actinomyces ruminis]